MIYKEPRDVALWQAWKDRLQYGLIFGVTTLVIVADHIPKSIFLLFIAIIVIVIVISVLVSNKADKMRDEYNKHWKDNMKIMREQVNGKLIKKW